MVSKKDLKILDILTKDCKLATREIGRLTGIPPTTVHNRVKKMEKEGIIKGYRAVVNKKMIGKGVGAYIHLTVNYPPLHAKLFQEEVAKKIANMHEVEEVALITGEKDILLKVYVKDTDELNEFITQKLRTVKGVNKTVTSVILKEIT